MGARAKAWPASYTRGIVSLSLHPSLSLSFYLSLHRGYAAVDAREDAPLELSVVVTLPPPAAACRPTGRCPAARASETLAAGPAHQGLTLVHLSAQPEPFLVIDPTHRQEYPTKRAYVEPKSGRV